MKRERSSLLEVVNRPGEAGCGRKPVEKRRRAGEEKEKGGTTLELSGLFSRREKRKISSGITQNSGRETRGGDQKTETVWKVRRLEKEKGKS